ncbi:copper homeostasis membrane protein CopD [Novosphingobium sp. 28-62-57]|uniref:copper homeostasis membrane protein CopD n=1 Tax=Novosphingobium sp. 28-62-57 TaxID=1970409 RepID=UPI0025E387B5|nr:copper homeostasis membrane protein CopD [Novosphingobium sp. 28-62-57]
MIAARAAAYVALLLVAGLPLQALSSGRVVSGRMRAVLALLALIAGAASVWWALESVAAMAGLPLAELDQPTAEAVLAATPLGAVMEWRLTALACVIMAAIVPLKVLRLPMMALAGAVALCSMALTGHAGASEYALHRWADGLHLLAAALWIGALAAFLSDAVRRRSDVAGLARFARTGSVVVAVLVLTGVVNTLAIAGLPPVLDSRWFWLLGVKIALFGLMLALAAHNRWRIVPALERGDGGAEARLRRSLSLEMAAGVGVVMVVAMLGVLDPAA